MKQRNFSQIQCQLHQKNQHSNNGDETLEANESIKSYDNFDQSPFKSFLKISDSVIIAKKNQPKNKKKREQLLFH